MPVSPSVRKAGSPAEYARFRDLLSAYEASLPPALRHDNPGDIQSLTAAYAPPNAAFIALIESEACGCVALQELDPSTTLLKRMYVSPHRRGIGIARALLDATTQHARYFGYARIVLDTDPAELESAYRLYLRYGFTACEPYASVDYPNTAFLELRLR